MDKETNTEERRPVAGHTAGRLQSRRCRVSAAAVQCLSVQHFLSSLGKQDAGARGTGSSSSSSPSPSRTWGVHTRAHTATHTLTYSRSHRPAPHPTCTHLHTHTCIDTYPQGPTKVPYTVLALKLLLELLSVLL